MACIRIPQSKEASISSAWGIQARAKRASLIRIFSTLSGMAFAVF